MKTNPFKFSVFVCALLTAFLLSTPAWAQKGKGGGKGGGGGLDFQIVALDNAGGQFVDTIARGINNAGGIVGQAGNGNYVAVYWTVDQGGNSTTSQIHLLPGGPATPLVASDINDLWEIIGTGRDTEGNDVAMYWSSPVATPSILDPLDGDDYSRGEAISDDGVMVGTSRLQLYDPSGEPDGELVTAVAWRAYFDPVTQSTEISGPVVLPALVGEESFANAINDNNEGGMATVAGNVESDGGSSQHAVTWTVQSHADGSLTADPTYTVLDEGAGARGVNNVGSICGYRGNEPVIWDGGTTTTLKKPKFFYDTSAADINGDGVIAGSGLYSKGFEQGYRAVAWPGAGGSMIDLSKSLGANSPFFHLTSSQALNDSNEIAGFGWDGTDSRAFLAVPD